MVKMRLWAVFLLLVGLGVGYFDYSTETSPFHRFAKIENFPLRLGLDLSGGTHLVYKADVAALPAGDVNESMAALRDVIERRVNLFGVAEPVVQVEESSFLAGKGADEKRLIVELPGLTDTDQAIKMIGQTPVLEFKTERPKEDRDKILAAAKNMQAAQASGTAFTIDPMAFEDPYFISTSLTGRYLKKATLEFDPTVGTPQISLVFNNEGGNLFSEITKENVGKKIAIYLDGSPISAPVVREEITGGKAQITGDFKVDEAKQLVGRLNSGALPVPIEMISAQTIGASLGEEAYSKITHAGVVGFAVVILFLVLWYRMPGILATLALFIYAVIMLALFKLIPVTLTSAGIAGFILSIGMAVDANILIFERMKEELRKGRTCYDAVQEGFARAWFSIRDSNLSSIISSVILFWFGTSMVQGFALTLGIGVIVSMFTALTVTRTLLLSLGISGTGRLVKILFGSGIK